MPNVPDLIKSTVNPSEREGTVTTMARRYQMGLDDMTTREVANMSQRYTRMMDNIAGDLAQLEDMIAAKQAAGGPVPVSWLHRQQKYRTVMMQAEREFQRYADDEGDTISRAANEALRKGRQDAEALMNASVPHADSIIGGFDRIPDRALRQYAGASHGRKYADGTSSPLRAILDRYGHDGRQVIDDEIIAGMAKGQTPQQIIQNVKDRLGSQFSHRTATLIRTETSRAYREANRAAYQANADVIPLWTWFAHIGPGTCASCLAMHGQDFPVDTPMGTHPNCRCTMLPKAKTWAELGFPGLDEYDVPPIPTGEEVFAGMSDKQKRQILGPSKYEDYRNGRIKLQDAVGIRDSAEWGRTRSVASQKTARENAQARQTREKAERDRQALETNTKLPRWQQDFERAKLDYQQDPTEENVRKMGQAIASDMEKTGDLPKGWRKTSQKRQKVLQQIEAQKAEINKFKNSAGRLPSYDMPEYDRYRAAKKKLDDLQTEASSLHVDLTTHQNIKLKRERDKAQKEFNKSVAAFQETHEPEFGGIDPDEDAAEQQRRLQKMLADGDVLSKANDALGATQRPVDLSEGLSKRLKKVRSMGAQGNKTEVLPTGPITNRDPAMQRFKEANDTDVEALYDKAMEQYPTDWAKETKKKKILFGKSRRGYQGDRGSYVEMVTSGTSDAEAYQTMIHEVGHFIENTNPKVVELERSFWNRRTAGQQQVTLSSVTGNSGYGPQEVTIPDAFFDPYIGKNYGGGFYEVVSMGFEGALTPQGVSTGGRNLLHDEEHLDLILGMLGGV